ncbi:hypothetical protein AB0F77_09985 [Streptomyces sp. NPDC026672]|uniref:hypothetical protein n=1 Tax=unclassified Streptomyces TaxID=2593676 RepID=UPI0033D99FC8
MPDHTQAAAERLDVLEGLLTAIERRHELIDLLSACASVDTAVREVVDTFGVTEPAARVVLDTQFRRLLPQQVEGLRAEAAELRAALGR